MNILVAFIALPLGAAFLIPILWRATRKYAPFLAVLVCLVNLVLSLVLLGRHGTLEIGGWPPPLGINLVLDGLSGFLVALIYLVSSAAVIFSVAYIKRYTAGASYYSLFLLMVAGMSGVVLTGDIFNLFVYLEIGAIAAYALVAFGCQAEELEASFKYLVLGTLGALLILIGIGLIYSQFGNLSMAYIAREVAAGPQTSPIIYFATALFLAGFGIKAALVPFHTWLPDAHPSAPAPISAMLSGILIKILGIYALLRILFNVFGAPTILLHIILVMGGISMLVGVLLALGQWDFKRLLAYHSISQMGYVMLAVGLGTPLGILGGLFHLANHAVFKTLLFLDSGSIEYAAHTRQLKEMGGLREKMPVTSATCAVASFSIAGLPPFNGFWSKLIIIIACIQAGRPFAALLAVIVSILTLASFLKVQRYAFFGRLPDRLKAVSEVPALMRVSMIGLAVLCVGMGLLLLPSLRELVLGPAVEVLDRTFDYSLMVIGK